MRIQRSASPTKQGKVGAGLILLSVGVVLLLHQFGFYFPAWLISWPMLLIALGLLTIIKHGFHQPIWLFFIGTGGVFLLDRINPEIGIHRFIWPILLIIVGLFVIFGKNRPRSNFDKWEKWKKERWNWEEEDLDHNPLTTTQEHVASTATETKSHQVVTESINSTCVFGGTKKTIISKSFTGGEIISFMGGAEINLNQSDIQGRVKLEITAVLGGVKLIIPSHWHLVTSEMVAVFGGIEDKRMLKGEPATDKILELEGTTVFGGIEIQSYS